MKEENKDKRVLQVELDNNVKKIAVTGLDAGDKVVMSQELNTDELEQITGGFHPRRLTRPKKLYKSPCPFNVH